MAETENQVQTEAPRYQSHKKVWALKIRNISSLGLGVARLTFVDDYYGDIETREGWLGRFNPHKDDGDLGYYVIYEDGFTSWSPTKAFEEGYTRI